MVNHVQRKPEKKISEAKKGRTHSKETRKKISEVTKGKNNPSYGKKWWNDGCGNTKFSKEFPGKGWFHGRK
jgi:hypothetical protein